MHLTTRRAAAVTTLTLAILALLSPTWLSARTIVGGFPDLDRMVETSDSIVQGEVVEVTSEWVDRRIQTTYRLRADRYIKGRMGAQVEITVLGGIVDEPFPLAMIYDGMVVMSEGQDVVLFLQDPPEMTDPDMIARRAAMSPALANSMDVTLGDVGVFTVIEDPETGDEMISRLSYGSGSIITSEGNRQMLEAAADAVVANSGQRAVSSRELKPLLLEMGGEIREIESENSAVTALSSTGQPIPLPGVRIPDSPAEIEAQTARNAARDTPTVSHSTFRSLDDFVDEVTELVNEEGR